MSLFSRPFRKRPGFVDEISRIKGKSYSASVREYGAGIAALRRAATLGSRGVVRIDGQAVAVLPLRDFQRVERLLEQEAIEKALDWLDIQEAERRLADPTQIPIPFEQALRELGLDDMAG